MNAMREPTFLGVLFDPFVVLYLTVPVLFWWLG